MVTFYIAQGCSNLNSPVVCANGFICPSGTVCAASQNTCISNSCGNGSIDIRAGEMCDDGNIIAGDGCSQDCSSDETCGNGIVDRERGEMCDDDGQDTAACDSDCTRPDCGDGRLNPQAGEACDDGNPVDDDDCNTLCKIAGCTDGLQNGDESDLDCGGYCGPSCAMLQSCTTDNDCMGGACLGGTCVAEWRRLTAGDSHTCVLLDSDTVRCWGNGSSGRLGYGNANNIGDDERPNVVGDVPIGGSIVQIAAGAYHTCAVLSTGAIRCWGNNYSGQLGYGHTDPIGDDESAGSAGDIDIGGSVIQITAGEHHTCALMDNGAVRCWGLGEGGRLGYGNWYSIGNDEVPATAGDVDVGGTVIQVSAGFEHTCALLNTGAVRCWGDGTAGRLGYGHNGGYVSEPATAGDVNVGGTAIQITVNEWHTCALLSTGAVRCWGYANNGQLGYGNNHDVGAYPTMLPVTAGDINVGGKVIQIVAGRNHTCALLDMGAVRCWGRGSGGQLGYGNVDHVGDDESPASTGEFSVAGNVIQIAAGGDHTCALFYTGAVRCWGNNDYGMLGYSHTYTIGDNEIPFEDVPYQ